MLGYPHIPFIIVNNEETQWYEVNMNDENERERIMGGGAMNEKQLTSLRGELWVGKMVEATAHNSDVKIEQVFGHEVLADSRGGKFSDYGVHFYSQ